MESEGNALSLFVCLSLKYIPSVESLCSTCKILLFGKNKNYKVKFGEVSLELGLQDKMWGGGLVGNRQEL